MPFRRSIQPAAFGRRFGKHCDRRASGWHSPVDATRSGGPIWNKRLREFIPSAQGLEKEVQEFAAVLECTQLSFLPAEWQEKVAQDGGRAHLQERMVAIRQLLEGNVIKATFPECEANRSPMAKDFPSKC